MLSSYPAKIVYQSKEMKAIRNILNKPSQDSYINFALLRTHLPKLADELTEEKFKASAMESLLSYVAKLLNLPVKELEGNELDHKVKAKSAHLRSFIPTSQMLGSLATIKTGIDDVQKILDKIKLNGIDETLDAAPAPSYAH